MRSIASIIVLVGLVVLAVTSVGSYLSIDDLKDCPLSPEPTNTQCAKADVIVAISGGDTGARAEEAVKLYKAGWANNIIFSGAALDPDSPSNAVVMQRIAIDADVPAARILLDENSQTTEANAMATRHLLQSHGYKRILLVTSPYHQHRAYLEFKQNLPDNMEIINHPTSDDHLWPNTWWMTAQGWNLAITEMVKTAFVQLRGQF